MKTMEVVSELDNEVISGLASIQIQDPDVDEKECKEEENVKAERGEEETDEEEEKLISLDWVSPKSKDDVEYIPKGPMYRSSHDYHKYTPYDTNPTLRNEDAGIPQMSERNDSTVNINLMKYMMGYQNDGLYIWFDDYNNQNARYVMVPYFFEIDFDSQTIGLNIPRLQVPTHVQIANDKCPIFVKVYPNSPRFVDVQAEVETQMMDGKASYFLKSQFIHLNPIKGLSGLQIIMSGVSKMDIDSAVRIVESKGETELFKTYGPNKDTLLSMLCFSRDQSASNRAKVLALTRKILSHVDLKYRSNLIFKNESDINALEFAATTNKPDIAVYIAEIFYDVGEDVLCTDSEGNTLLHLLARKGDVVSPSLKALLDITLQNGDKMFPASVSNNLGQTPMHIAARGSDTVKTLEILSEVFPGALKTKSKNGSLPIHMACQYSSNPSVIQTILDLDSSVVNETQMDGYAPLHLLAIRGNNNNEVTPLDEIQQLDATKQLVAKGADARKTVANRSPFDLVANERVRVKLLLKLNNLNEGMYNENSKNILGGNLSNGTSHFYPSNEYSNAQLNQHRAGANPDDLKLALMGNSPTSPTYSSGFESSPSSVQSSTQSKSSAETSPAHPRLSLSPTNTDPIYQYSPTNSQMHDFKSSGEEDEGEEDLDTIAQYLYQHPSIQNAMNMAERLQ